MILSFSFYNMHTLVLLYNIRNIVISIPIAICKNTEWGYLVPMWY